MNLNPRLSKNSRVVILVLGLILFIFNLFTVEYSQFYSRNNLGAGLRIIANILIIMAMIVSLGFTAKKDLK